jgi:hypothetical protein
LGWEVLQDHAVSSMHCSDLVDLTGRNDNFLLSQKHNISNVIECLFHKDGKDEASLRESSTFLLRLLQTKHKTFGLSSQMVHVIFVLILL